MKFLTTILYLVIFSPLLFSSDGNGVQAEELKAADGQLCANTPAIIANLPTGLDSYMNKTYCDKFKGKTTKESQLFLGFIQAAVATNHTVPFFTSCFEPVMVALETQQAINSNGKVMEANTLKCVKPEAQVYVRTELSNTTDSTPTKPGYEISLRWELYICKPATCATNVLNDVLSAIYDDLFSFSGVSKWTTDNYKVLRTITPTTECYFEQMNDPMNNPELYCGESAPVCTNTSLIEVKLDDGAPFEVAFCNDDNCLASMGTHISWRSFVDGAFSSRYPGNPFCLPLERVPQELTKSTLTKSEKEFKKSDYCSVAAKSGRIGRCTSIPSPKVSTTMLMEFFSVSALTILLLPLLLAITL